MLAMALPQSLLCSLCTHFGESCFFFLIMSGFWILLNAFSSSIEIIVWFLSFCCCWCSTTLIDLGMLNQPCDSRIHLNHDIWFAFCVVESSLLIFCGSILYIYFQQRYWPVIFFFGNVFVWFWYQGDGAFIEWL